jgi:hypothetical protein
MARKSNLEASVSPDRLNGQPKRRKKVRSAPEMLALEPRIMFDGAAVSTAERIWPADQGKPSAGGQDDTADQSLIVPQALVPNQGRLILISARLPQAPALQQNLESHGTVVLLDPERDVNLEACLSAKAASIPQPCKKTAI